jgi:hypothetical protein
VSRYRCVDDQKAAGFPVTAACDAAEVSTSGYYDRCAREAAGPTERQVAEAELVALMRAIFESSDGNYGVPRMYTELRRAGLVVNKKRVHRLMRLHGMAGRHHRRRCRTTFPGPDGYQIPDLIGRRFEPGAPDAAWVQDITYIPTGEGWLFLASVLDLGSRRLLGYSMADHMRTELVLDALGMAIAARGGDRAVHGVTVHADRGSQGGFNWSSQHLEMEVVRDGIQQAAAGRSCDAGPDVVPGAAVDSATRGSGPVLGGDRPRCIERRRRCGGRRVPGGRGEVVPAGWRDASDLAGPGVGPLSVVR